MKYINKQALLIALIVHIFVLLLIWGGISTLGCAVFFNLFLTGWIAWYFFQKGKIYALKHNVKKQKPLTVAFRG